MLRFAAAMAGKDLRLLLCAPAALGQSLLLGLLLIFIFSLSKEAGEATSAREAAAIFWLGSAFCQTLIFNQLYALEEINSSRQALILVPAPVQGIWFGKLCAGFPLLLAAQMVFLPASIIFLGQRFTGPWWPGLGALVLADTGMAALGSLLGALAQGQSGRESLLTVVLFPLLLPLILAAINLSACSVAGDELLDAGRWLGVAAAFDAVFIGASLVLFGFIYQGDE